MSHRIEHGIAAIHIHLRESLNVHHRKMWNNSANTYDRGVILGLATAMDILEDIIRPHCCKPLYDGDFCFKSATYYDYEEPEIYCLSCFIKRKQRNLQGEFYLVKSNRLITNATALAQAKEAAGELEIRMNKLKAKAALCKHISTLAQEGDLEAVAKLIAIYNNT